MRCRFADFLLDRELGSLAGPQGEVRLRPQTLRLLEVLVENAPRVLSTDELIDRSWGVEHVSVSAIRQSISELRQALGDSATSPKIIETVHRRGYRFIAPVEHLEMASEGGISHPDPELGSSPPESPPQPAATQPAATQPDATQPDVPQPDAPQPDVPQPSATQPSASQPGRASRPRSPWLAGFVLFLGAVLIGWLVPLRKESGISPALSSLPAESLVIEEISNLTGDPSLDWIGPALTELLESRLAILGEWTVYRQVADDAGRETDSKIAHHVTIHGSYATTQGKNESHLHLLFRVEETATGRSLGWARKKGHSTELPDLAAHLARSLLGILDEGSLTEDRRLAAQKMLASNSESLRLFSEALVDLEASRSRAGRAKLEQAVEVDPDNPLLHESLAEVYDDLGLDSLATRSAEAAERLASDLPWELRISAEARVAEVRGAWSHAVEHLRLLVQRYPQDLDSGLRLAKALHHLGRHDEALRAVRHLQRIPGAEDSPLRDLTEVQILMSSNRLQEAEEIVRRLHSTPEEGLSDGLSIEARRGLLAIHLRRGELDAAQAVVEGLEQTWARLSMQNKGSVLRERALLLQNQGFLVESLAAYDEAELIFQELGDLGGQSSLLNRKAHFLLQLGEEEAAREALERGIELNRTGGIRRSLIVALSVMARVEASASRPAAARSFIEEALALRQESEDPRRASLLHRSLGDVLVSEGRWKEAEQEYLQAIEIGNEIDDGAAVNHARLGLFRIALAQRQFDLARSYGEEAVLGFLDFQNIPDWLGARCALGELALVQGDLETAEAAFGGVLTEARALSLEPFQRRARIGLTEVTKRSQTASSKAVS